jgi:putative oxidoreductase
MTIVLWVLQILLGLAFLMLGFPKAFQPVKVAKRLTRALALPRWFLRFIGGAEMLAGIGLILPAATHILPWLTVAAAIGLLVLMFSAIIFHISRREFPVLGVNALLLLLAALVVVGRLAWAPF